MLDLCIYAQNCALGVSFESTVLPKVEMLSHSTPHLHVAYREFNVAAYTRSGTIVLEVCRVLFLPPALRARALSMLETLFVIACKIANESLLTEFTEMGFQSKYSTWPRFKRCGQIIHTLLSKSKKGSFTPNLRS